MAQQRLRRAARDLGRRSALGARSTQTRSAAVAVLDELQVAVHAVHGRHLSAFSLAMRPRPLGVARSCSQSGNVAVLARGKLHFTCNLELVDSRPSQQILELAGKASQLNLAGNSTTRGGGIFVFLELELQISTPRSLKKPVQFPR